MAGAWIPYGAYWSTPFARWQGAFAHLHPLEFGAWVAKRELARRQIDAAVFDWGVLGITVPSKTCVYGLPWVTGMIGAMQVGGPTVNQACATSARMLQMASREIIDGAATVALAISADKCSNGPHLYFPAPAGPGGTGSHEDWVLDNFSNDPLGHHAMVDTAENVARKYGISSAEQHEVTLQRYEQYDEACADDHAFHRRYMTLPFEIPDTRLRKVQATLWGDDGIHATTREGLSALRPVREGGTVTFGSQTHPGDGSAATIVTTREKARELSSDPSIEIELVSFGQWRTDLAHMPEAPVGAARRALQAAGITIDDIDCVKSHNPFAVNDICFARETGFDLRRMNNFGCSLVWGHPQGPTGLRAIIELIEELVLRGGGTGLFHGCAAGDSAMATVVRVSQTRL